VRSAGATTGADVTEPRSTVATGGGWAIGDSAIGGSTVSGGAIGGSAGGAAGAPCGSLETIAAAGATATRGASGCGARPMPAHPNMSMTHKSGPIRRVATDGPPR
jgi:hypothetical protein